MPRSCLKDPSGAVRSRKHKERLSCSFPERKRTGALGTVTPVQQRRAGLFVVFHKQGQALIQVGHPQAVKSPYELSFSLLVPFGCYCGLCALWAV